MQFLKEGSLKNKSFVSLKLKLILYSVLIILILVASILGILSYRLNHMIKYKLSQFAQFVAKTLASASLNSLITSDYNDLQNLVDDISKHPDIKMVYVIDASSNTIVAADKQNILGKEYKERLMGKEVLKVVNNEVIVVKPVKEGNKIFGFIVVKINLARHIKDIENLKKIMLIVAVVVLIVSVFLSMFFMNKIVISPMEKLVEGMQKVSSGDFNFKVDIKTNDEFELLSQNFNDMVKNINTFYYLAEKSNFVSDVDALLKLILQKAVEVVKAQRGSLMLLDKEGNYLETAVVIGLKENPDIFRKFKVGEGIAGKVADSKKSLMVNLGHRDPNFKLKSVHDKNIQNLICVPMIYQDQLVGVINVVNKESGDFTESDQKFLETVATQAAGAILKAKLYEESITDGLTGLYIHKYFQARLEEELKRIKRYGGKLALVMFDIDHFKSFNDTYGHQQGDIVLKYVAKILKNTVRQDVDVPCRYGGEEFAVIMPNTDHEGAAIFAERLRKNVEQYEFPGQEFPVKVTISLGVAVALDDAKERLELIKKADIALYYSKENGRNQVTLYRDISDKVKEE